MTDDKLAKVRAEIERLIEQTKPYLGACAGQVVAEANNKIAAYNEVLALLDTMQEEPISEDLEEAAIQFATDTETGKVDVVKQSSFFWGAIYHKQQMMKEAFDFTKEHNTACILASECLRNHGWFSRERDFNDLFRHLSCVDKLFEGKFSGKTKVIVIKED